MHERGGRRHQRVSQKTIDLAIGPGVSVWRVSPPTKSGMILLVCGHARYGYVSEAGSPSDPGIETGHSGRAHALTVFRRFYEGCAELYGRH